ncbi:MAG: hypothetical protein R3D68_14430 [Hyphomicrobiaceae bacterium]
MSTLTELEQRILAELEEAGEESVQTLAVTLLDGTGSRDELMEFTSALISLVQNGFVLLSISRDEARRLEDLPMEASLKEISRIDSYLDFDQSLGRWMDRRHTTPPYGPAYPYVVYTERGEETARGILKRRGYRWWRK